MSDPTTLLQWLRQSLHILEQRRAKVGLDAPASLTLEIDDHQTAITLTEQLAAGRLTETTWREQLQPLLVTIEARQATEPVTTLNMGGVRFGDISNSTVTMGNVNAGVQAGGDVVGGDKVSQRAEGSNIAQASHGGTATVNAPTYHQQGQQVETQYNAGRDINIHPPPATPPRDKNLTILLSNVRKIWVEDYLHSALLNAIYLDLGLETKQDAVPHPFEELNIRLRQPEQAEQDLPPGTRAIDVYRQAGGSLLILGQPGAGKTTMLATLAGDLVVEAENDPSVPVPVIFNLSSWAAEQKPLGAWLAEELNRQYQVSRKLGQRWLAEGQLALLLDGLDEVAADRREVCVEAINAYRDAEATGPLVVCSRLADYEVLQMRLKLGQAIVLKKLTRQQVEHYFQRLQTQQTNHQTIKPTDHQSNDGLMTLFKRIWQDEALRELTETPLMLNIITATYAYPEASSLPEGQGNHARAQIFAAYSERMFNRVGRTQVKLLYQKQTSLNYLSYLATQLQAHNLSQFSIGQIRGRWLPAGSIRRMYRWMSGLVGGLIGGLMGGLSVALSIALSSTLIGWLSIALSGVLIFGLIGALIGGLSVVLSDGKPAESIYLIWGPALKALGGGILGGLLGGGGVGLLVEAGIILPFWIYFGLIIGLIFGLFVALRGGLSGRLFVGLIFGLFVALRGGLSDWLFVALSRGLIGELIGWLIGGLSVGLIFGLIFGLIGALSSESVSHKFESEQELRRSWRSSLIGWLIGGLSVGLFVGLIGGLNSGLIFGLSYGLSVGLSVGLTFGLIVGLTFGLIGGLIFALSSGGIFLTQHYVRLWLLNKHNLLPFKLIPFLNQATELIFLQRIGGSYRFIHRSVQEYFAEQYDISVEDRG